MRKAILKSPRTFVTAGIVAALIILAITPISSEVRIPAVLEASRLTRLYPALPAKIEAVHVAHGDRVVAGARLVSLASSDLLQEMELNRLKAEVVALRQARRTSDAADREEATVLDNEMAALQQQRAGLSKQRRELDIVAPFAGNVVELTPGLHQGRWLNPHEPVAVVRGDGDAEVRGALSEQDLWRLSTGARARFIPDDLNLPSVPVRVDVIALAAMAVLDQPELASSHGGRVADRPDQRHQSIPVTAQYGVRGRVLASLPETYASHGAAGVLIAEGRAESAVSRAWRQVLKVLVRESGL